jgi:hypothetical protein
MFNDMSFYCVAAGSFNQGDSRFSDFSSNAQCVANATTALAWKFCGGEFTTSTIDSILLAGDTLYKKSRLENSVEDRYLFPEDLSREISILGRTLKIEDISFVYNGLYPTSRDSRLSVVKSLAEVLQRVVSENCYFLFTGQLVTVSIWCSQGHFYLFDSHAVNEVRQRDSNSGKNLARLFTCSSAISLADLLLSNAALGCEGSQFGITEIKFSLPCPSSLIEVAVIPPIDTAKSQNNSAYSKKGPGRPKKVKRGRPKVLETTREQQIKQAKKKYSQQHPEVNRDAVKRYSQDHPEVNRKAVKRYSQGHPEVNQKAVKRYTRDHPEVHRDAVRRHSQRNPEDSAQRIEVFRLKNPRLTELRHLPVQFARLCVDHGPMACWGDELLDNIEAFKLKNISLWNEGVHRCPHCQARLFEEEKSRVKWCCGQGAFNILDLPPLIEPFYSDKRFLERARAYNDLFAFCALEIQGGYRHPSGLSFFKIEGRMYHQVYNLDAPGQKFTTKSGNIQFVNRSRLYIDDGEERKNIAMGRSLDGQITGDINIFLSTVNPYVEGYRRLSLEPSVSAHLDFELTTRATHGPVLGDRQTGIEVHAVLSTDESLSDPRKITVWKTGSSRPTSIDLLSPLMEPFQYPLLYPQGTLGWHVGRLDNRGNKLTQYNYSRCLLLSEPRFSHIGRLSQAWQVEMFARYEEEKLRYIKFSQINSSLRIAPLDEIIDAQGRQVRDDIRNDETVDGEGGPQPGKVYLPSSFTGGPRYMKIHYENAMALVSRLGSPTFFLTFTYSATWEENKKACPPPRCDGRSDPSTACRVFQIKLLELLRDLRSGAVFGRSVYIVYVIEMQMRGLPHAHIVFKIDGDGPVQAADIDSIIRADIPSGEVAGVV